MSNERGGTGETYWPANMRWISELNDLDKLIGVLLNPDLGDEAEFCRAACRRAIALEGGVDALHRAAWSPPRLKGTTAVLATLWAARRQEHVRTMWGGDDSLPGLNIPITPQVAVMAARRLSDLMAEATSDGSRFHAVLLFATQSILAADAEEQAGELARLMADSSISLTLPLIGELERLVTDDSLAELEYQAFLSSHPVLLDPLAANAIDRHRLGDDLVTDFVIRRHDNRYVAVEIEKPRDRIFTRQGDFTAEFTHAFGQVVDFLGWMDENLAYARTKLRELEAADGLVVIGRRSELGANEIAKLRRFCQNSRRIDVCTFDDLVVRAMHLYESIHHRSTGTEGTPPSRATIR